jgi:hypothetical protein
MAEHSKARLSADDDDSDSLDQLRTRALYIFNLVLPKDKDIPPSEVELLELVNAIRAAREVLRPFVTKKKLGHTWRDNTSSDPNLTTGVDSGAPKTAAETRAENVKIVVEDVSFTTVMKRIRAYEFILLRPFLMIGTIMVLWAFGGAVVFYFTLHPKCVTVNGVERCKEITYPMALYYATQAGFSVGFGLLSERQTAVRWYTIFHGLVGLTIIAAGLTLFLLRPGGRLAQRIAGDPERVWKESTKEEKLSRYAYRMFRKFRRMILMELPLLMLFLLFSACVIFQVSAPRSGLPGWPHCTDQEHRRRTPREAGLLPWADRAPGTQPPAKPFERPTLTARASRTPDSRSPTTGISPRPSISPSSRCPPVVCRRRAQRPMRRCCLSPPT